MKRSITLALIVFMVVTASAVSIAVSAQDVADPAELADPDGKFVEVNGARVYYLEHGPQDGPPVLLLHGFLGSTTSWDNTIDPLVEGGYRVIAFDRPPFGLSDKRVDLDYSLNSQADLTAGLMDALGIERAVLVGHSAGGAVLANFALRYPQRVAKLAFVSGAVSDDGPMMGNNDLLGNLFTNIDPESPLAQAALRTFFTSDLARGLLAQAYADPEKASLEMIERGSRWLKITGWEAGLLAFVRDSTDEESRLDMEQLTAVEVPVLLIWGEEDQIVPLEIGERLRELFPIDVWIVYPGVGHIPMDENTDQFNDDLMAFLASE